MESTQDASTAPAAWARARGGLRPTHLRTTSTGAGGLGGATGGALGIAIDIAGGSSNDEHLSQRANA